MAGLDAKRASIRWAKLEGLQAGEVCQAAAGVLQVPAFASIGSSIFGRRRSRPEAPPRREEVPYSPKQGTYAYDALQKRFKELDKENQGYLTENGLKMVLKELHLPASEEDVQSFLEVFPEARVPFDQFAEYAVSRENLLYETFKELDKKNTGYLTDNDLKAALQKYHFRASDGDISSLVRHYKREDAAPGPFNQSQLYDFADFRSVLVAFSRKDLRDADELWGRAIIDTGDVDTTFPLSFPAKRASHASKSDTIKHLTLGAVVASVTRTIVSPLERMKILSMMPVGEPTDVYHNIGRAPESLWKRMWSDGKVSSCLRGNLLNIARIIPTRVAEFLVYDKLRAEVMKRRQQPDLTIQDQLFLGSVASAAGVVAGYPLDTLRTVLAAQLPHRHVDDLLLSSIPVSSLFKGLVPSLLRAIPYSFVTFTVFEKLQSQYRSKHGPGGEIPAASVMLYGIAASLAAQTFVHPLEVVQRRLQVEGAKHGPAVYHSMLNAFGVILEKEGVAGLYSGLIASYAKIIPATAVSLLVYKALKENLDARTT